MAAQTVINGASPSSRDPQASINVPNFKWHSADQKLLQRSVTTPADPPLGVLASFSGNFSGNGLNTIFRPQSGSTNNDNTLEINLTTETLNFGPPIGSVPNRGLQGQADVFLNGVSYVQTVNDVANPDTGAADGEPVGIHFEPGIWMHLPATDADPPLPASIVRMGSIPHGTTINAQSLEPTQTFNGPPVIPAVDITPFVIPQPDSNNPPTLIRFPSQIVTNDGTPRLPQDLTKFIAAGTITQDILTDPNTVLRNANKGKNIVKTEVFTVSTTPSAPEFGGGTANIAFLLGASNRGGPNANAVSMTATFWINTVQSEITVPGFPSGNTGTAPLRVVQTEPPHPGARVPTFVVQPPSSPVGERTITVTHTEIQYSQTVFLNFAGLTWPHVAVATLVPTADQHVPAHALSGA